MTKSNDALMADHYDAEATRLEQSAAETEQVLAGYSEADRVQAMSYIANMRAAAGSARAMAELHRARNN